MLKRHGKLAPLLLLMCCFPFGADARAADEPELYPIYVATDLFGAETAGSFGYVDRQGRIVIEPQFAYAGRFSEGLAAVEIDRKYGFIDEKGKVVIKPEYSLAKGFSEGRAAVCLEEGRWRPIDCRSWSYVDKSGKLITASKFEDAEDFSDGLAAVKADGKYGFINKQGETVIAPQLSIAQSFRDGLARVWTNDSSGFINKEGKVVINVPVRPVEVVEKDGTKRWRSPDQVGEFSDGLAPKSAGDKWGYIDRSGKQVVAPRFDLAGKFSEGYAPVFIDGKYGYVDTKGEVVIKPQFYLAGNFSEGLAPVRMEGGGVGYIDKRGQLVIEPLYEWGGQFLGGVAQIEHDVFNKLGYIDKGGNVFFLFDVPRLGCDRCHPPPPRNMADIILKTTPDRATVYFVPERHYKPEVFHDDHWLEKKAKLALGLTNIDCQACVKDKKYWAIIKLGGKRCRTFLDVTLDGRNRWEVNLNNTNTEICQ